MSRTQLETRGLKKHFPVTRGFVQGRTAGWVKAVDGVDLTLADGETLGLVGESGCGKTTVSRLLLRLETPTEGAVLFRGEEVGGLGREGRKAFRRAVQPVFQNPYSSLDPRMQVGRIVAEPLAANGSWARRALRDRVGAVLEMVGLQASDAGKYPHEFSGGQRQRVAIARALASEPRVIVLDEAVSSQDISIRAQILNLLKDLQQTTGVGYLFIAHDLATVRYMSHRVAVMYLGKVVETGDARELCTRPLHPYTQALFSSALPDSPDSVRERIALEGEPPSPLDPPLGCRFHTRCRRAKAACREREPELKPLASGHQVACFLYA